MINHVVYDAKYGFIYHDVQRVVIIMMGEFMMFHN